MAQLVYIRRIRPNTFLHFSSKGESFRLRDYSRPGPPIEVMRQGGRDTVLTIMDEAQEPGNMVLPAPRVNEKDWTFWHEHIVAQNAEYPGTAASTASLPASHAQPASKRSGLPVGKAVETASRGAVGAILGVLNSASSPDDDPWLAETVPLVDEAIDRLVEEFLEHPYLHRVEHSIHAQLFHAMMSFQQLAQRVTLGDGVTVTQLVHKEWPETVARDGGRRGNFDLAVLSPDLLLGCDSVEAFRNGRLSAPIVIEIGLDYDAKHLAEDAQKVLNSKPPHSYLVHLVREVPRDSQAEQIILGMQARFARVKTAYGWRAGNRGAIKRVNDTAISER